MTENKEESWSHSIPSDTIVQWFYAMFILVCVLQVIVVGSIFYRYTKTKGASIGIVLLKLIPVAITVVNSMFLYILASRTLKA